MSSLRPEYFGTAQRAAVETTFGIFNKTLDGARKLVELNVQTVKSTLEENQENLVNGLSSRGPQALLAQQKSLAQTAPDKAQAYWRHVCEILSGTQGELVTFIEAQSRQYQHKVQNFVDNTAKTASVSSESAVAAWSFPKTPG
ncbi:Phasin (modular protein) [Paraburkholderia piptadeniae]|uniref:Phasin (Modular protein) n=1 Tax=Paraburkholderia piptadeniae TaxID=1701573 RepID=A0A1N7S9B1_9BURK|nr:phasin family protein [Paraburkholderia piptadeniae]SIT43976.1 Phasin (modular protein) [Paraburkholderia piptadeniae]